MKQFSKAIPSSVQASENWYTLMFLVFELTNAPGTEVKVWTYVTLVAASQDGKRVPNSVSSFFELAIVLKSTCIASFSAGECFSWISWRKVKTSSAVVSMAKLNSLHLPATISASSERGVDHCFAVRALKARFSSDIDNTRNLKKTWFWSSLIWGNMIFLQAQVQKWQRPLESYL